MLTKQQWLRDLLDCEAFKEAPTDSFTVEDLAVAINRSRSKATTVIRQGLKAGTIEYVGRKKLMDPLGRAHYVAAYKETKKRASPRRANTN